MKRFKRGFKKRWKPDGRFKAQWVQWVREIEREVSMEEGEGVEGYGGRFG